MGGSAIRRRLIRFLEQHTHQSFGDDLQRWREWMWTLPYDPHPDYAEFKGIVYGQIDQRMRAFFPPGARSAIRTKSTGAVCRSTASGHCAILACCLPRPPPI